MTAPKVSPPTKRERQAAAKAKGVGRPKRTLTRVQKLREHVLIELGVNKADIAAAIGTTRQTVSAVFLDDSRSQFEGPIVDFLRKRYTEHADNNSRNIIDALVITVCRQAYLGDVGDSSITRETMGWPEGTP